MNSPKGVVRVLFLSFFASVLFLGFSYSAHAQGVTTASITGKIGDASGAAVPETMVAVTSEETGVTRNTVSDTQGDYLVLLLPVGRYEVKAEKMGFKTAEQTGIDLVVGQTAVVNLVLAVGDVQQVVTVSEEAPLVNTTTAPIAGVVGERAVKELPLNGRSFDELITLNAGSVEVTKGAIGTGGAAQGNGNEFSVSGRHWSENIFLLNGVEYPGPSQAASLPGGVSGQLLGIDAVREFNVVADTYGASYGHRAGAQVSLSTQSGTNALHGSVFEFLRNSDLDARNFFEFPTGGHRIGEFRRNQFGGAAGGPIQKDKTFIFGNYEGYRQFLGVPNNSIVPDAITRANGSLPDPCTGAYTTAPGLQAQMLAILNAYYPAPSTGVGAEVMNPTPKSCIGMPAFVAAGSPASVASGTFQGNFTAAQTVREDFGTARMDHVFSDKDTLSGIFTMDDGLDQTPEPDPIFFEHITVSTQVLSFQETHIFSPRVINNFIAGYGRVLYHFGTPAADPNFNQFFLTGAPGTNFPGEIQVNGLVQAGGSQSTNQLMYRNVFTLADNVQVTRGRHTLGFGVWFSELANDELAPKAQSGLVVFNSEADFLAGALNGPAGEVYNVTPVQTTMHWKSFEGAWFVEDNVQLRSNLSFRIGLRHEFTDGWSEAHGNAYNFVYDPNNPGVLLTAPVQESNVLSNATSNNNAVGLFAPRVAIAWDPFGKGKTSIRAGYGMYYDLLDTLGEQNLDGVAPLNGSAQFTGQFTTLIPHPPLPPQCNAGLTTNCSIYSPFGVDPNIKTPQVHEWNLTYEQEITPNTSLRISYVGSHAVHTVFHADPNQLFTTTCGAPAGCVSGGNLGAGKTTLVPQGTYYVPPVTCPPSSSLLQCLRNPFLGIGGMFTSYGISRYNGLNVEVTHRTSYGLQFKAAYTYSRELDEKGSLFGTNTITLNPRYDYGPADWNDPHKFTFSGGYELPWGQKKHFMSNVTGVANQLVSGWQINWIVTVHAGQGLTLTSGNNTFGDGESGNGRPNWNGNFTGNVYTGQLSQWFNPSAFSQPVCATGALLNCGTFGDTGRNILTGPTFEQVNLSIFKNFKVTERLGLQFRTETFNLFNTVNFNAIGLNVFTSKGAINGSAGVFSSAFPGRQIQFGLKALF